MVQASRGWKRLAVKGKGDARNARLPGMSCPYHHPPTQCTQKVSKQRMEKGNGEGQKKKEGKKGGGKMLVLPDPARHIPMQ